MIGLLAWLALAPPNATLAVLPPVVDAGALVSLDDRGVEAEVRARVEAARLARVTSAAAVRTLLQRARDAGIRCDVAGDAGGEDCAARLGAFAGVDFVVVATVRAHATARASVMLLDCNTGAVVRRAEAPLARDDAGQRAGLRVLVDAALGRGNADGTLRVTSPAHGTLVVDARVHPPGEIRLVVPAGLHDVEWRPNAGEPQRRTIDVPVAAEAAVTFDPNDGDVPNEASAPGAWGRVGLVTLVAGGLVFAGSGAAAWAVAPDEAQRDQRTARAYNDAVALGRVLVGVSAAGLVVAGLGAGALALDADPDIDEGG